MSLFDHFKKDPSKMPLPMPEPDPEALSLLETIVEESLAQQSPDSALPTLSSLSSYQKYKAEPEQLKKELIRLIPEKIDSYRKKREKQKEYGSKDYQAEEILKNLFSQVLRSKIHYQDDELLGLIQITVHHIPKDFFSGIPFKPLITKVEENIQRSGLNDSLQEALALLLVEEHPYMYGEHRSNNERIHYLLNGTPELKVDGGDPLGVAVTQYLNGLEDKGLKGKWSALIDHLISAGDKGSPSKKWMQQSEGLLKNLGRDVFVKNAEEWILLCKDSLQEFHQNPHLMYGADLRSPSAAGSVFLRELNHNFLKALIWAAGTINDPSLNAALDEYGQWALKKLPGVGVISLKTGNACLYSFSILPYKEGISRLTRFRMKVKHSAALKQIEKYITQIAAREGLSQWALEEMNLPDFGLDQNGLLRQEIGDYIAVLEISTLSGVSLSWEKGAKKQAAVPAQIKKEEKEKLHKIKKIKKDIEALLPVQRDRIEQFYLKPHIMKYPAWISYYLNHPLLSFMSRRLIWHFSDKDRQGEAIFVDGEMRNVKGERLDWLTEDTSVSLWHPLAAKAAEVMEWRELLLKQQIVQPFKQAFREIYLLTDAELKTHTYSNRFAAHVLRQQQFAALCKQRGWHYSLQGSWDSFNTPYLKVPHWHIRAAFLVAPDDNAATSELGIYQHVMTDQVRFYKHDGKEEAQMNMEEVPAMVFSEIMRDVDLFVGVSSIGNDPAWQDGANTRLDAYWREYSFAELTESARLRAEVLKNLIPRLKIAEKCSFEGKYLKVKGRLREYRIHMASGNILMWPNDEYLCIVPQSSRTKDEKLFLPFEGDQMLSIIISKAFLLAEDHKIKDPDIVRQLER